MSRVMHRSKRVSFPEGVVPFEDGGKLTLQQDILEKQNTTVNLRRSSIEFANRRARQDEQFSQRQLSKAFAQFPNECGNDEH